MRSSGEASVGVGPGMRRQEERVRLEREYKDRKPVDKRAKETAFARHDCFAIIPVERHGSKTIMSGSSKISTGTNSSSNPFINF
jgi:hypothetical protein